MVIGHYLFDAAAQPRALVDGKAPFAKPRQRSRLGAGEGLGRLAPGIGEEFERPRRRDARVELAQRAGGEIARIGENLLAGGGALRVESEKRLALHIDFAADLD